MNATPLPPAVVAPAAPPQGGARARDGGQDSGGQFNAHLEREVNQRQAAPTAASTASAPARPAAGPQRPQAGQADKPAPAGQAAVTPDAPVTLEGQMTLGKPVPGERATRVERVEDLPAYPVDPMIELMGLVASFNQPGAPLAVNPEAVDADASVNGRTPAPSALAAGAMAVDTRLVQAAQAALSAMAAAPGQDEASALPMAAQPVAAAMAGAERPARFPFELAQGGPRTERTVGASDAAKAGASPSVLPSAAPGVSRGALPEPARADSPALAARVTSVGALPDAVRPDSTLLAARGASVGAELPVVPDQAPPTPLAGPLTQGALGAATQEAAALVASDKIPARVGTPAWDNQVAQKVVWMVAGEEQSATLTLNPPDMGPMQVVLSVTNDHATVTFSSATPEVRQALQDAMPTLREMMGEAGIALGDANVNDGAAEQRQAQAEAAAVQQRQRNGGGNGNGRSDGEIVPEPVRPTRRGGAEGLVDTFA